MLFIFLITANAGKIWLKAIARAFLTLLGSIRLMLLMSMFAYTAWSPGVHVEALASREPPHSDFLWAARDEVEWFAIASGAVGFDLLANCLFMARKQMSTKAFGLRSYSKTVIFGLFWSPSDVNTRLLSLLSMLKLPCQHFLGTHRWSNLTDTLQDRLLVIRLS